MANQSEPLVEAWGLFRLGQLPAAIRLAETAIYSPISAPQAQLLLVRCLLEQGRFRQAQTICTTALIALLSNTELGREIQIRRACLQIYLAGDLTPILEESRATLTKNQSPILRALAQDLLGRGKAIAAMWNLSPPSDLVEAADIKLVRSSFIESNPVAAQTARLGLVSDKEKVYKFAIKLHYWYLKLSSVTSNWLEQLKGRAFLDSLALTSLRPPSLADEKHWRGKGNYWLPLIVLLLKLRSWN